MGERQDRAEELLENCDLEELRYGLLEMVQHGANDAIDVVLSVLEVSDDE